MQPYIITVLKFRKKPFASLQQAKKTTLVAWGIVLVFTARFIEMKK